VDFERETIRLPRDSMKNALDFEQPLHPELLHALRARMAELKTIQLDEPIVQLRRPEHQFSLALDRAGLSERSLRLHDLRQSAGTWAAELLPEAIVAQLLGHAKTSITSRYTQHHPLETLRQAMAKLPWIGRAAQGDRQAEENA
jgi:integrase